MLTGYNGFLEIPQGTVSPVQHSPVFIIYTNSRTLFGGEQRKFRVLKSNVQSQKEMWRESANTKQTAILRHKEKNWIVVKNEEISFLNGCILNTQGNPICIISKHKVPNTA